ncbi:MAG: GvpL/GvpF family gas vesicle protein [Actinomycetes bacterium]
MPDVASDVAPAPVYFYGVVRGEHAGPMAGVTAIDGEGEVYGIAHRELTVIVSDAHQQRYEVSRQHVRGHEAVVTALMDGYSVLPARFGSVRDRNSIVDELLVAFYEPLHVQLEQVEGMMEVGLIVRWVDMAPVIAEIVADDPWLRAARRRLAISRVSQNMRLDVGKRIEASLEAKRLAEADAIVAALAPLYAPDGVNRNDHSEEGRVLDAAFLVGRDKFEAFDDAVRAYDSGFEGRYTMEVGTPTAPYGFVPLLETVLPRNERVRRRGRSRR